MTQELEGSGDTVARLSRELPGRVLLPGDGEYDGARGVYFTGVDRRPSAIVRPVTTDEVARVVRIVAAAGERLTVKGGGHGFASRCLADGVVAVDLSGLSRVEVDAGGLTARAGGGATTGAFTAAAGAHGLATGFGDSPKVGIGGITQSGGIGFLHRRLGLTADSLLRAEVVTASGEVLEVDGVSHPELWWGLRGGGGGMGVLTRLDFRLHPVDRVMGGMLMAPATPERFHRALEALSEAPPEVSGLIQAFRAPPAPFIPEELHGTFLLAAYLVHSGSLDQGRDWVEGFRSVTGPVVDQIQPIHYPELFAEHGTPPAPPLVRWRSAFREELTLDEVGRLFGFLEESHDGIMRTLQVRPLGGAVRAVSPDATAFPHRDAALLASVGTIVPHVGQLPGHVAWVEEAHRELTGGRALPAYAGFLGEDDPAGHAGAWPSDHAQRLQGVRQRYDPAGVFRGLSSTGAQQPG